MNAFEQFSSMSSLGPIKAIFDPPKAVTVGRLDESKVTLVAILMFRGPKKTVLSNFYPYRLWGK